MQISNNNRCDEPTIQNTGFISRMLAYFTRFFTCTRSNVVIEKEIYQDDRLPVSEIPRESDQDFALRILQQLKKSPMPAQ